MENILTPTSVNPDFENIYATIDWYRTIPKDFNDVDTLIRSRKNLSCHSVDVARFTGQLKKEFDRLYFLRKLNFSKEYLKEKKNGLGVADAEHQAKVNTERINEQEKTAEGEFSAAKLLLHQINEVLSTMSQDISYLKSEKRTIGQRQTT